MKEKHPHRYAWTLSLANLGDQWSRSLWSGEMIEALLTPELYEVWKKAPNLAVKADIGRLVILQKYGGLYMDIDYLVLKDFSFLFTEDVNFLCVRLDTLKPYEKSSIEINNAIFAAAPNYPLINDWLHRIAADGPYGGQPVKAMGAFEYTTKVTGYKRLNTLLNEGSYFSRPEVRVISNTMLEPLTLNNQNLYCNTLKDCQKNFPSAYGIHLTDGSWIDNTGLMRAAGRVYGALCDWSPILLAVFFVMFLLALALIVFMVYRNWKSRTPKTVPSTTKASKK